MWTLVVVNSLQDRIRDFSPSGAVVIDDQSGVPLWSGDSPMSATLLRIYHLGFDYAVPDLVVHAKEHRVRGRSFERFREHLPHYLGQGRYRTVVQPWSGPVPGLLGLTRELQPCEVEQAFERLPMKELVG